MLKNNPSHQDDLSFEFVPLKLSYDQIESIINTLSPQLADETMNPAIPRLKDAQIRLESVDPEAYGKTRNFLSGAVSRLSPFISRGLLSLADVFDASLKTCEYDRATKWVMELMWRSYFRNLLMMHPEYASYSAGLYKTGHSAKDYQSSIPEDILQAKTPNAAINQMIRELIMQGTLHNHARMYLASYFVHFRRIDWKTGADWMFHHLIDADLASNHLSWQWVASTLSSKPYFFNLENLRKYAGDVYDCSDENNPELVGSYESLAQRLFTES